MKLFISFSGGETSGFMAHWLLKNAADRYDEIICLFANTGQENEQTLEFVQKCDEHFGLAVVWLEAKVYDSRKSTGHRIVNFETASRDGEPFERVIQKYGIPNQAYPHCTRELKLNPMRSYLRSIGWMPGNYETAIGIRVDEFDRIQPDAKSKGLIYPLVSDRPTTKPEINAFWNQMPFRLNLKGYEGNCKWCWKKSLRKQLTLAKEHPEWFDFPERMEAEYGLSGHNIDGNRRVFFRKNTDTREIRRLALTMKIDPPEDDSRIYEYQQGLDLDITSGCSESCEVEF